MKAWGTIRGKRGTECFLLQAASYREPPKLPIELLYWLPVWRGQRSTFYPCWMFSTSTGGFYIRVRLGRPQTSHWGEETARSLKANGVSLSFLPWVPTREICTTDPDRGVDIEGRIKKAEQNKTQILFSVKICLEIWKKSLGIVKVTCFKDLRILYHHH